MKIEELVYALAIEPGDTSLDTDGIADSNLLISVCAGIVTFEPESRIVGLVHYTAQEYLIRKGATMFPDAQREISLICLTTLSFENARKDYYRSQNHGKEPLQLAQYAVGYWADHMRESPDDSMCEELALEFVCSQGNLAKETVRLQGAGILILLELQDAGYADAGLCALAALGLNHALVSLLDEDLRLHASNSKALSFALLFAAFYGHEMTVALLIEQGANVNYRSALTETALHYATYKGHEAIAKLLLDHGAKVDALADIRPYYAQHLRPSQPHRKWTSLHLAASLGQSNIVRLLLRRGAKVAQLDDDGHTPLHLAAVADAHNVVEHLEADIYTPADIKAHAWTPPEQAPQEQHGDQVSGRAFMMNLVNNKKQTALHLAASFRSEQVVAQLIKAGAEIDAKDENNNTALLVATNGRDASTSIVEALLDAGANVNATGRINGRTQNTALHLAVEPAKHDLMHILLGRGANPNARDAEGSTPMHLATWLGSGRKTYEALLQAGADLNARDIKGNTILHLAVVADDVSTIEFFLEKGATPGVKNNERKTPLDVALEWKRIYPCGIDIEDSSSVVSLLRRAESLRSKDVPFLSQSPLVFRPG